MSNMEYLLLVLAILGGMDLAWRGAELVVSSFPPLLSAQAKTWRFLADSFTVPAFRKRAIATRVEEVLNQTAFKLQRHLPKGWIKRAKIRWVRNSKSAQLRDGDIVLRVRPGTNPDHNLMQTLWLYFHCALFPDSKDLIPDETVSAIALAIARASLEETHQYLLKEFDEVFLPAIEAGKGGFLDHFGDCVRLNDYGFLMGPFVRELEHAANNSRFGSQRAMLPETISGILDHMLRFQPLLRVREDNWFYEGPCTSYGFLLVSKPRNIRPGIEAYFRQGQSKVQRGIDRLYVIGRHEERDFVLSVIRALLSIRELKGVEMFPLFRDYRGDANGVGALLGVDHLLATLDLTYRPVEPLRGEDAVTIAEPEPALDGESSELDVIAHNDLSRITEDLTIQLSDYEGAWISLAEFGNELRRQVPGFTPSRYGGRNLISVLKKLDSLEFDERGAGPAKAVYVRLRAGGHKVDENSERVAHSRILEMVREHSRDDGWIFLGTLGHYVRTEFAEFNPAAFGALSMRDFINRIPTLEVEEWGEGHSKTYVRIRQ